MKEISKDMLYTILSGVGVFVVSQLIMEFILKPVIFYKELKGRIASNIVYAAQYYENPLSRENFWDLSISEKYKEAYQEVSNELRKLASELAGFQEAHRVLFPCKDRKKAVELAILNLIGLSNGLICPEKNMEKTIELNEKRKQEILKALDIQMGDF